MRRVVVLRPEPGATETFETAVKEGLNPVKLPLFEIERLAWVPPEDLSAFDGLLLTSANAIREAGNGLDRLNGLPVYAVGPATAKAAREAGFEIASVGSANLRSLLQRIDSDLNLLHLAGEDRIDPRRTWQKITVLPVYRATPLEGIDFAPIDGSVALVHSARAGARLAEIARNPSSIAIAAISQAVAEACGVGWQEIAFAGRPNDLALLAVAAKLCKKTPG